LKVRLLIKMVEEKK